MNNTDILEKMKQDDENFMEDVVIYNLEKFIRYCNNSSNFEYDYDFKQHKEVGYLILTLIAENKELKEKKKKIINKLKEDIELASTTVKWIDERTKQVVPSKTIIVNESDYAKTILKIMEE